MQFAHFDIEKITDKSIATGAKRLSSYRSEVQRVITEQDADCPEYALAHVAQQSLHDQLAELQKRFKGIRHLVLIGIGGSNLGTAAVHDALGEKRVRLHQLDTIAPYQIDALLTELKKVKQVGKIAVCVVSKSGGTTETMVNAGVLLEVLEAQYGKAVYEQTICIGDPDTEFMQLAKRRKATLVPMPSAVGGRYSVATEVGLVPLTLLGHDVDSFMGGVLDASSHEFEAVIAEQSARLSQYNKFKFEHYAFFACDPRLATLGAWYRQLQAESLGKSETTEGKPVKTAFVPAVMTPVELHSVGQLYFSGVPNVYTDFVTFDDDQHEQKISKKGFAKSWGGLTTPEVATGIYGGVLQAYQEKSLPYRSVIFDDDNLSYSLGLFMGMRMLETMYVAKLLGVNAFDQPNVELYKQKTKEILGV